MKNWITIFILSIWCPIPICAQYLSASDILSWDYPTADFRISYGEDPLQFGDLRIPHSVNFPPVAIIIHGGCYLSKYDIKHIGIFAQKVTELGIATWTVEYRRVGDIGGSWPGTFQDIINGTNYLNSIAEEYSLDLNNVIVIGHSSGGHLALWLGSNEAKSPDNLLNVRNLIKLKGILALAASTDLQRRYIDGDCDKVIEKLIGGKPSDVPERYLQTSPIEMEPINIPQILIVGTKDREARIEENDEYFNDHKKVIDDIKLIKAKESGHFELIDPTSSVWKIIEESIISLIKK